MPRFCIVHSLTQLYSIGDTADGEGLAIEMIQASAMEPIVVEQAWSVLGDTLGVAVINNKPCAVHRAEWTAMVQGSPLSTLQVIEAMSEARYLLEAMSRRRCYSLRTM